MCGAQGKGKRGRIMEREEEREEVLRGGRTRKGRGRKGFKAEREMKTKKKNIGFGRKEKKGKGEVKEGLGGWKGGERKGRKGFKAQMEMGTRKGREKERNGCLEKRREKGERKGKGCLGHGRTRKGGE